MPRNIPGETGCALWKKQSFGDIRVRMVEYFPGYAADHWCSKGHVILCLTGRRPTRPIFALVGMFRSSGIPLEMNLRTAMTRGWRTCCHYVQPNRVAQEVVEIDSETDTKNPISPGRVSPVRNCSTRPVSPGSPCCSLTHRARLLNIPLSSSLLQGSEQTHTSRYDYLRGVSR